MADAVDEVPTDAATKTKNDKAAPQPRADAAAQRRERQTPAQVINVRNNFYAEVQATGGTFGFGGADSVTGRSDNAGTAGGDDRRRRETGRLREEEIESVTGRYAEPNCFVGAESALRRDQVVVIEGPPGSGRRAGAISLLHKATKEILVLSPMLSLRALSKRAYDKGVGYLVVDRQPDGDQSDVDFTWATVLDQVRDAGAYLVVTSIAVAVRAANRAVRHVTWERPPDAEVLRAQLVGRGHPESDVDDTVTQLLARLPEECTLARLVELARLIREGVTPDEALARLDENAGREVRSWFAEKPSHQEILEVTALCFLAGSDVRRFETLLERLRRTMTRHMPKKKRNEQGAPAPDLFGDRGARDKGDGLVRVRHLGTTSVMEFKDEAYVRFVLDGLWRSRSVAFWNAVRDWLDDVICNGNRVQVAYGLSWLACVSADEVQSSYLERWSWGKAGAYGHFTAAYVLWHMCNREGLAPVALQTATRWATVGDIDRRWTAILAFCGELGISYPTDATNRLWQLITQTDDVSEPGCAALACLFATLAEETEDDARVVLRLLDRTMEKFGTGEGNERTQAKDRLRMRAVTMTASLEVVSIFRSSTNRPAIFEFLHRHPEWTAVVARIWAGVIRYRPLRQEALVALRRALYALREISDDARDEARAFGIALNDALPPPERPRFKQHFLMIDEQMRRGKKESPAEVLLACLEAITENTKVEAVS